MQYYSVVVVSVSVSGQGYYGDLGVVLVIRPGGWRDVMIPDSFGDGSKICADELLGKFSAGFCVVNANRLSSPWM